MQNTISKPPKKHSKLEVCGVFGDGRVGRKKIGGGF